MRNKSRLGHKYPFSFRRCSNLHPGDSTRQVGRSNITRLALDRYRAAVATSNGMAELFVAKYDYGVFENAERAARRWPRCACRAVGMPSSGGVWQRIGARVRASRACDVHVMSETASGRPSRQSANLA